MFGYSSKSPDWWEIALASIRIRVSRRLTPLFCNLRLNDKGLSLVFRMKP